jgi:UDP-N-acetylmuramoyl-tripeptide--D-alanyl-D-alanine ligase
MIKPLFLKTLVARYAGTIPHGDCQFNAVSTDTRYLEAGELFVALKGPNYDAHDFLQIAADKAACGLVVDSVPKDISLPYWLVDDTVKALGQIASLQRENYSGQLIAVTGSSGKTTVKGLLASILSVHSSRCASDQKAVFATVGNLNNHIGLPLSLLSLNAQHRFAVMEMGASALGEINYLTHIAKPHVAVITNVMPAHVEGFGSIANIARAKGEIFNGLEHGGTAIINQDDTYAEQWLQQNSDRRCLTFSATNNDAAVDVWAENIVAERWGCYGFRLCVKGDSTMVKLPLLGIHNVSNALAAAACSIALGVDLDDIVEGVERFTGDKGRLQAMVGYNQCTLVDDSYNANPGSVAAAIDVLANYRQQKLLVLGDMCELGEDAREFHRQIGRYANDKKIDCLLTFGQLSRSCQDLFNGSGDHFDDFDRLISTVKSKVDSDTVVLIKGSRSLQMDKVVAALSKG